MSEERYTRCPGCRTIFRVTEAQLALRAGQVRCGHCRTVFNGRDHAISLLPDAATEAEPEYDELAQGPPTVTLRSAHALDPPPPEPAASAPPPVDYDDRFSVARKPSQLRVRLGMVSIPILALALTLQVLLHFRDVLAAQVPATRPVLSRICAVTGCVIRPLRDVAALSLGASDLQADPAHRGLLILSAMLRNHAPYPVGYPYLELTLTDLQDQPVVRRALSPSDYVSGTTDTSAGIPGNVEVPIKLFIDASATTQAGYRLYLFFP